MDAKPWYVQLSVNFSDDPRVLRAGPTAELILLRAFQLAKRSGSDGVLLQKQMESCGNSLGTRPKIRRAIELLEAEGLIQRMDENAVYLAGWLSWNKTKAQQEERANELSSKRSASGALGGKASGLVRREKANTKRSNEAETKVEIEIENKEVLRTSPAASKPARPLSDFQKLQLALARVEGIEVTDDGKGLSNRDWSRLGKAAKDIADCDPSASPTSIAAAANRYRTELPNAALTASALASWWTRLKAPKVVARPSGFGFRPNEAS